MVVSGGRLAKARANDSSGILRTLIKKSQTYAASVIPSLRHKALMEKEPPFSRTIPENPSLVISVRSLGMGRIMERLPFIRR